MIQGKWIQACIAVLIVEMALTLILPFFVSNIAIIYLISDIISAFVYAIVYLPFDRIHFYRYSVFHYMFSSTLVMFCGITIVFLLLGWY